MEIQSLLGLLGVGLTLGMIAIQTAKSMDDKRKKIPIRIDEQNKKN